MRKEEEAYSKGYRVDEEGNVFGPTGKRKLSLHTTGYFVFNYRNADGKNKHVLVSRLAAYQWFGAELYTEGFEVRHLDGNPKNNTRANIAIGTKTQNAYDRTPESLREHALKAARSLRKLSSEQVAALRADRVAGADYKTLMAKYGVAKGTVSYIVNGATYKEGT